FSSAFDAAEAKGGCATMHDAGSLEAIVDSAVAAFVAALPDGGTDEGRTCAASKLGETGKKASGELACQAKATNKGTTVDPLCLGKADDKFTKAFTKANSKGGCADPGDASTVGPLVDTFAGDAVAGLTGPPPAVSFASDVQPIFTASCAAVSGCHTASFPAQGMNLSSGMAYEAIVRVASLEVPSLDRVAPGLPPHGLLGAKDKRRTTDPGPREPARRTFSPGGGDCPDHERGAAGGAEHLSRRPPPRRFPPTQLPDASDV